VAIRRLLLGAHQSFDQLDKGMDDEGVEFLHTIGPAAAGRDDGKGGIPLDGGSGPTRYGDGDHMALASGGESA
jgi:hypothetical protein